MSDNVDLDAFEKDLYSGNPVEVDEKEEVSEPTPSATNDESNSEDSEESEGLDGDDTPEDTNDEEEENKTPKPRKRRSAQERINDLTREKYELLRLLDLERQKQLSEPEKKSEVKPTQAVKPDPEAPSPDAVKEDGTPLYPLGEFDPQFVADLSRYTFKLEFEKTKKAEAEAKEKEAISAAQKELTNQWQQKVSAATERLPDLPEKFGQLQEAFKELPEDYANFLASSIMKLDNGPDVLDYFADNLEVAQKIVKSGPFEAVLALGKLDQKFTKAEGVEKGSVKPTQAPPPPPKNKGSAVARSIRPDTPNLDDFEKIFYNK